MNVRSLFVPALLAAACGAPAAPPAAPTPTAAETTAPPKTEAPKVDAAKADAPKPDAPKPAARSLTETPEARLGTVPAGLGLKVGAKAPDATLPEVSGKTVKLADAYAEGPTYVVFYRGGWCPFCNLQLHELSTAKPEFDKRGVRLVAISVDKPDEEAKTQAKQGVPFAMLSDSSLAAHKAFNVVHVPSPEEAKALANFGVDLDKYSGQTHHDFAVPAIFLVDKTGTVRWQHVDNEYKTRPSTRQLLDVADRTLAK